MPHQRHYLQPGGRMEFEPFDVEGYFNCIERMRHEFPQLGIFTGTEFGQPHLFEAEARAISSATRDTRDTGSIRDVPAGTPREHTV